MSKNVIITGASGGIGSEIALVFAENGWNVAVNYNKNKEKAEALVQRIKALGVNAVALCADVSVYAEAGELVKKATEALGEIDVLVNNAGIAQQKLFCDITEADYDRMFSVNMKSVFNCCKAVVPQMIHRHSGSIINISSMWGQVGASCEVHYSASKAAVIGFTKALAKELGPSQIRVNCVSPGVILTEMNANLSDETMAELKDETPLMKIGMPRDIAKAVYFLATDSAQFITGQDIGVNGGMII